MYLQNYENISVQDYSLQTLFLTVKYWKLPRSKYRKLSKLQYIHPCNTIIKKNERYREYTDGQRGEGWGMGGKKRMKKISMNKYKVTSRKR